MWQPSPKCSKASSCISFQLRKLRAGGCCPLTSSSTPLQLSKLGLDNSQQVKCWWSSGSGVGPCFHPVVSPQGTPEILPLVWWRHNAESVYTVLAHFQPRWLKGHQLRWYIQCKGGCVTTPACLQNNLCPHLSCILVRHRTFLHGVLSKAQLPPPCSGSLEVSVTQILRMNNQASPMAKEPIWRPASCRLFRTHTSLLHLPILQTLKLQQTDVQG